MTRGKPGAGEYIKRNNLLAKKNNSYMKLMTSFVDSHPSQPCAISTAPFSCSPDPTRPSHEASPRTQTLQNTHQTAHDDGHASAPTHERSHNHYAPSPSPPADMPQTPTVSGHGRAAAPVAAQSAACWRGRARRDAHTVTQTPPVP